MSDVLSDNSDRLLKLIEQEFEVALDMARKTRAGEVRGYSSPFNTGDQWVNHAHELLKMRERIVGEAAEAELVDLKANWKRLVARNEELRQNLPITVTKEMRALREQMERDAKALFRANNELADLKATLIELRRTPAHVDLAKVNASLRGLNQKLQTELADLKEQNTVLQQAFDKVGQELTAKIENGELISKERLREIEVPDNAQTLADEGWKFYRFLDKEPGKNK